MVLVGSQLVIVASQWFSVVLTGSRRFSVVLVGSQCARRFSVVLVGSPCFSVLLDRSHRFSVFS